MKKRIYFFQQRGARAGYVKLDVLLDGLSPIARWIADVILTTDRRDAAGWVSVRERLTNEQVMRIAPRPPWEEADTEKYISNVRARFGEEYLERREQWTWDWDSLRRGETGEQYLERHAAEMLTRRVDIIHGPNFGKHDPPPPTALRMMTAGSPEATA